MVQKSDQFQFQVDEYTRLEEEETLIENNSIFCESQIFRGQTTLVSGLLKLENFT